MSAPKGHSGSHGLTKAHLSDVAFIRVRVGSLWLLYVSSCSFGLTSFFLAYQGFVVFTRVRVS